MIGLILFIIANLAGRVVNTLSFLWATIELLTYRKHKGKRKERLNKYYKTVAKSTGPKLRRIA